jgi:hypothetical protein
MWFAISSKAQVAEWNCQKSESWLKNAEWEINYQHIICGQGTTFVDSWIQIYIVILGSV